MATAFPLVLVTPRDKEILQALEHVPLTVGQLRAISQTFRQPFQTEQRVRERMQRLVQAGRVRQWPYATLGHRAPNYYTLSPEGYRLLHGHEALLPRPGFFHAVAVSRQEHTRRLADFLVNTIVSAYQTGVALKDFKRENSLCLAAGDENLYPDSAFRLILPTGQEFSFLVELDRSTERVWSTLDADSWERKVLLYNLVQDHSPRRFRVLVVTTGNAARLSHILDLAGERTTDPKRSLFCGITLSNYLAEAAPLTNPCLLNHRGEHVPLLKHYGPPSPVLQAPAPAVLTAPAFA